RPEGRLRQVDVQPDQRVLPPPGTRHRPALRGPPLGGAEERLEDVLEPEARAEGGTSARGRRVDPAVVHLALLRVGEHLVRARDVLEPLLGTLARGDVRVQLTGEPSIGLLDLVGCGVPADAEHPVVVAAHVLLSAVPFGSSVGRSYPGAVGPWGAVTPPGSATGSVPRRGRRRSSPRSPSWWGPAIPAGPAARPATRNRPRPPTSPPA